MTSKVQKWGNSLALRIPRVFAKDAHLHQGSVVQVSMVEGKIVVSPTKKQKYSLSQLLKGITPANRHSEMDFGAAKGKEVW